MKKIITIITLFFVSTFAFAQQLTGQVTNSKNLPLENVYLQNQRNGSHTHTDDFGYFLLRDCKVGDSIRVALVGYKSLTIAVSEKTMTLKLVESDFQLNEVVVSEGLNHLSSIARIDIATNPVNSSQELLRKVPGLFIGQHAGGGKAEQLFLRGFDLDHGTDINISVDGSPVNMVSHGHGQGYADLHFLIPETVEKIDFDKGPYHASKGNLATAGYVAFETKDRIDENMLSLEGGSFHTMKVLGLFNLLNSSKQAAYLAGSYIRTDGPFQASQDFKRLNLFGKYVGTFNNMDRLIFSALHFNSKWNASGQIPQRAVDAGLIGRFGAIDSNEGGETDRTNFNLKYDKYFNPTTSLKTNAFYSNYNFELYSNFTFFLEDPINGDQIKQKDSRNIFGIESALHKKYNFSDADLGFQFALGARYDDVDSLELSHTKDRNTILQRKRLGNVDEANIYAYTNVEFDLGRLLINPSLRYDYFHFSYQDLLTGGTKVSKGQAILSPKLNFLYNQSKDLQFFLKLGKGFHSNDTRVVVTAQTERTLPAAYGADLGLSWKPAPRLILNAALWYLYLQQEFVYVGDAGEVEPSGRTSRKGVDFGLRYQLTDHLFLNGDLTYNRARSIDDADGENHIPLAPPFTFAGGLSLKNFHNLSGSLKSRYLASRPANEDNSIVAKGYFITDANLNYNFKRFTFGIVAENIFNRAWNETQFATESRLQNEISPVEEIHFTPGTPFSLRASIGVKF